MKRSHRTGLVIGLGLLCLLITAMLLSHFFTRGMPGTVASLPAATEPTAPSESDANDESAGAPGSSTLAFNLDLDSGGQRDGMKSDRLRGIPTGGGVGGSENGAGSGGSNFGDVLFVGTNGNGGSTPFGGGTGGWFGGIGSGGPGSGGGPGGGGPGNSNGPSGSNGPFSNGLSNDDPHFVGDNPPFGGGNGNGPIGPIAGGGGPGGGSGSGGPGGGGPGNGGGPGGGGPGNGGGPGGGGPGTGGSPGTGGNGSGGGPGGIQDPDRFFSDNGPGGNGDGPSNTTPIPTSNGSVPAPPSIVLMIGGVGLLLGAAKLRRPGNRS